MIPQLPDGFSHPMRIGEGAFASVYRVRQDALERWVALKFIFEKDRSKRRDLLKEAQTQARLHAECVPQIYDAFEWRQRVCMVMEWVRGISLASLLADPLDTDDRLSIAGALVRALAAIHGQGFVHRDLKPENILLSSERGLFLVDFGFSKNVADVQVSTIGIAKGTPAYMAPELWSSGGGADLMRADIYAAGKILLQVLSSTPHASNTAPLIHEDPMRRPATGVDLLLFWETNNLHPEHVTNWKKITGEAVARQLSDSLFNASERLLFARRSEEAYWLLVESLEENGGNVRALELMGSFQQRTQKKSTVLRNAVFAALLLIALSAAFFAGMRSSRARVVVPESPGPLREAKIAFAAVSPAFRGNIALREDKLHNDRLGGRIMVRGFPPDARLTIDNSISDLTTARTTGLYLHAGEHTVTLHDRTDRIIRNEIIRLLPFQTKAIDYPSGEEGRP